MKKWTVTLLVLIALGATAQTKIKAEDASKHIGDSLMVCGKVFGGRFFENAKDQPTLLNVGAAYPQSPFTIVIYGEARKLFKTPPEKMFNGKDVCVTGVIKDFKGKPQIVVTKVEQLIEEKL